MAMFTAIGTHGPVLSPIAGLVLDLILLTSAALLLLEPKRRSQGDMLVLTAAVIGVSLSRVLMAGIPNVQFVTIASLLVGARLGARRGAAFAILVAVLSNYFLGDGWWTIFQAIGWASVAVIGSYANLWSNHSLDLKKTCYIAFISAFMFDFIVSLSIIESSTSFLDFTAYLWAGIPYDLLHAVGNVTFALWFAEWFVSKLEIREVPTIEEAIIAEMESTQA